MMQKLPQIIGEQPRPRLLIINPEDDSPAVMRMEKLAPTVRFLRDSELGYVRQLDWDAAVVFGDAPHLEDHLYVIQFGGDWGGAISTKESSSAFTFYLKMLRRSRSVQFIIPDNLPDAVKPLMSSLVGLTSSTSPNQIMWAGMHDASNQATPVIAQPFLEDPDHFALAGCYLRPRSSTRWWWLPSKVEHSDRWLAAALEDWNRADPDRFPAGPSWQEREEWSTPAELTLRAELEVLQKETDSFLQDIERRRLEIVGRLETEFARANISDRRLIAAQGDDLVCEVQAALEEIGFVVTNVDREIADPGDRREDLRVRDPDNRDWIAIVEVRGYRRGAQLNDLLRIGRFVSRFVEETGKLPSAAWYVVNHNLLSDPTARPDPLASNPSEIGTFAEGGGLIIDSRFLFRLRMDVRSGRADPRQVRAELSSTVGVVSN